MFGLSKVKMVVHIPSTCLAIQAHSCFHCTDDNDGNHMAQRKLKQRFDDIVSIIGRQQQSVPKISRLLLSTRPIDLYRNSFSISQHINI